jgi:hypothetical protein
MCGILNRFEELRHARRDVILDANADVSTTYDY